MHQRDYILRIIEQLGAALAELRRRILSGRDRGRIRDSLSDAAGQAGYDMDLLRGFDLDTLRMLVSPTGEVEPARCWLMAELLYLDGLEESLAGSDGRESLLKARALYDLVRPAGGMLLGFPEANERIAEIDGRLEETSDGTPPSARRRRLRSRRVRLATA